MQRLRSTFKRSRTPTGAEMKSQSSLEVPKQIRSASFDEIQLEAKRQDDVRDARSTRTTSSSSSSCSPARSQDSSRGRRASTLRVPQLQSGQRSKSFDVCERSYGSSSSQQSLGGVRRPETPTIQVPGCYHCACVEEHKSLYSSREEDDPSSREDEAAEDANDTSDDEDSELDPKSEGSPEIRVTLMTFNEKDLDDRDATTDTAPPAVPEIGTEVAQENVDTRDVRGGLFPERQRRRSIASPKLARQEALTSYPVELPTVVSSTEDEEKPEEEEDDDDEEDNVGASKCKFVVRDIFLTVPELKRDRAASVDSCFNSKNGNGEDADTLTVPQQNIRSKSVDIVLPTEAQTRYTALLPGTEARPTRGGREEGGTSGGHREPRSTPDWGPGAINGEHLWVPTSASGDFCYVNDCSKHGPRMKCAACRVVAHAVCAVSLNFACKSSFRDVGVRQYREQTNTLHHWVHRRSQKGKCGNCGKSFQSKLSFTSKEIVAVSCSWCKVAYHNKEACFNVQKIGENCELGAHASIIVPPSWIVKLPRKGSFKSSLRKSPRKKKSGEGRKKSKDKDKEQEKDQGLWVVKPIPTATVKPVLVFINPKSGGNQGAKLLQKFQWLLNPRQVFDLTQGGPKMGLELFKTVPNLRVLACGGDGTVGWVLSILDQIGASPPPAVGVLPLGTGNDLARALGWGGGYTDEPIGKILSNIGESDTTLLDRWQLVVERNPDAQGDDDNGKGKENLPLNVVNNYFSLGVDAYIALEFHEAREAHPERFNSRLRNKMYYGQMGGKDLVRRKWKDLSEFVTLDCDGQDMTPKLKEHRVHAIVFLNIASYGGGTHPWGATSGTKEPSTDDGMIEVVGLTTYQLPLLQAGGHGTCIAQCSAAKLVTTRTIPMQVDGEACRLLPSIIEMKLLNKATMLAKRRNAGKPQQDVVQLERLKLPVMKIKMSDYERYHHDKDMLKKSATTWISDPLDLDATTDLESLRKILAKDHNMDACCFLDSCTAERFFRIDRAQEQLHYVTDVAVDAVYVLEETVANQSLGEPEETKLSPNQEPKTAQPSPSEERPKTNAAMTEEPARDEPAEKAPAEEEPAKEEPNARPNPVPESTAPNDQDSAKSQGSISKSATSSEPKNARNGEKASVNANRVAEDPIKQSSSSKSISATVVGQSQHQAPLTFISPRDRLFGLSSEVHSFSTGLLEKTSDGILKAAKIGDFQALKDLHSKGYSLLSIDATGQTALHLASRHDHRDIVRYLIACAPSTILNMIDNDKGQTALHKAAQYKRRSICCMLVAGGASLTIADRRGHTPRDLALQAEDRDLAAYLYSQEQFQLTTEEMENAL
ncbi:eye-specific diacylglycerol kinase isoform X1 [Colletes gigas]|uniref:eye-specific diacylglycerol kinase isoform X1 n=1 Tax=Colletes gigas TaxID=935657 RepID=UPI001C9B8968|nr:eye-specific diacylglycerol kinase isoform X1 [Colletes gigas]